MKKQTIKLNESQLRNIIKESVKNVLSEMALHNKKTGEIRMYSQASHPPVGDDWKWKYDGDSVDKHMWRMKKLGQEGKYQIGTNGWPTFGGIKEYICTTFKHLEDEDPDDICYSDKFRAASDEDTIPVEDIYRMINDAVYTNKIRYEQNFDEYHDY